MSRDVVRLRRRSSVGSWLFLLVGLGVFVALGWTGFWYFAAQQSASSLDAWIAREKAFHRTWTCPDRQISGYPFTIEISCSKPRFTGNIFGRRYSGALAGFVAKAEFAHPQDVAIKVRSPFAVVSDDRMIDLALSWDRLDILLGGLPQDVAKVAITGQGLSLKGHAQKLGVLDAYARAASAILKRAAGRNDHAIDFHVVLESASFAAVDAFFRNQASAEVVADGTVTRASFDPAQTLPQTLDQWRAAGGHVDLADVSVTRGAMKFQAKGSLALDAAHELDAKLDTKCVGFEPVLRRLGVDPALISGASLLSRLFGGNEAKAAGPQPLHLPIGFEAGRLSIGPVITSIRLPPVY